MIVDDDQGARFVTRYRPMKDDRWGSLRNEALTQESPPLTGWIEIVVQAENETIICHLDGQRVAAVKDDFGLGDGEDMRWGVATASGQMECMRLRSRGPDGPVPLRLSDARLVAFRMERFFRGSGRGPL
jgi:hypothetical protein